MRYDLRKIMRRAWEIKREDNKNIFGLCLKMAWNETKNKKEEKFYGIKTWFVYEKFSQGEREVFERARINGEYYSVEEARKELENIPNRFTPDGIYAVAETEKALKFKAVSEYGTIWFWCPKSCMITGTDIDRMEAAFEKGAKYNETLVKLAKENRIKGARKGLKTITLERMILSAGVSLPKK